VQLSVEVGFSGAFQAPRAGFRITVSRAEPTIRPNRWLSNCSSGLPGVLISTLRARSPIASTVMPIRYTWRGPDESSSGNERSSWWAEWPKELAEESRRLQREGFPGGAGFLSSSAWSAGRPYQPPSHYGPIDRLFRYNLRCREGSVFRWYFLVSREKPDALPPIRVKCIGSAIRMRSD
jgi:hypothetical protein